MMWRNVTVRAWPTFWTLTPPQKTPTFQTVRPRHKTPTFRTVTPRNKTLLSILQLLPEPILPAAWNRASAAHLFNATKRAIVSYLKDAFPSTTKTKRQLATKLRTASVATWRMHSLARLKRTVRTLQSIVGGTHWARKCAWANACQNIGLKQTRATLKFAKGIEGLRILAPRFPVNNRRPPVPPMCQTYASTRCFCATRLDYPLWLVTWYTSDRPWCWSKHIVERVPYALSESDRVNAYMNSPAWVAWKRFWVHFQVKVLRPLPNAIKATNLRP